MLFKDISFKESRQRMWKSSRRRRCWYLLWCI